MASEREEMTKEVTRALDSALERLHKIWKEIGIVEEQRKDRMNVVILHLHNLLDEMVNEEERLKDKVVASVESLSSQLVQLSKELSVHQTEPQEGVSMLQKERELRIRVDKLSNEKNDRMKKMRKLRTEDQHLCDVLQHEPYYIPSNAVPSKEQLRELSDHITELSKEKDRRYQIFKSTKENIVKFMNDLEKSAESSFEKEIIHDEEDSFQLTNSQLKAVKELHDELEEKTQKNFALARSQRERIQQLWDRLDSPEDHRSSFSAKSTGYKPTVIKILKDEISRLECIMLENMQKVIEGTRSELTTWWDKCYISEAQRAKFKPFFEEDFSEESLKAHDQEVNRVKQYYKENEEMLERIAKRQKLWDEFLEFERKASDPNRLFNRGCNLLKEEKARKKLMKELPKVEQEVKEYIEAWEQENNRQFYVDGTRFVDYINKQWLEYNDAKENEKASRQQQKVKETEQEMMYGSKPTPGKRRIGVTTPSKTPNKVRKISGDENCVTSESVSSQSSVASSTMSHHNTPRSTTMTSARPPVARVKGRVRQLNDTHKTPGSVSRLGRTTMQSPMCIPPRSASKTPALKSVTPRGAGKPENQTPLTSRRVLSDKSKTDVNDTHVFSQTTVSGGSSVASTIDASLASLQTYNDFARGLNSRDKVNCRSSVVPRPSMYM